MLHFSLIVVDDNVFLKRKIDGGADSFLPKAYFQKLCFLSSHTQKDAEFPLLKGNQLPVYVG